MTDNDSAYARMLNDPKGTADKMLHLITQQSIQDRRREELAEELVGVKVALAEANLVIANIRGFLPDIQPPGRY